MIDENLMEQIIPLPDEEEKMEQLQIELTKAGFPIRSFKKGGIMYHLTRLSVRVYLELKQLARDILNSCFFLHAEGDWLDIKAADFSKSRIEAKKARGYVTIYRSEYGQPLKVTKGHGFKTVPDSEGNELKYYTVEDTVLPAGEQAGKVLVEAEGPGMAYNIGAGRITVSMIYLDGMDYVTNEADWLYEEGTETETDAALRERGLASWSELATQTIDEKLKNAAMGVSGVIDARIDSQHPRGQGTVDIIITSTTGTASESLVRKVQEAVDKLKGQYSDYLVRSTETVTVPVDVIIYLTANTATDGVAEQAKAIIRDLMQLPREDIHALYRDKIIQELSNRITNYRRTEFLAPVDDVVLEAGYAVITPEDVISVEVKNLGT